MNTDSKRTEVWKETNSNLIATSDQTKSFFYNAWVSRIPDKSISSIFLPVAVAYSISIINN